MVNINNYISEKLHINKDTKISKSLYNILINMCKSDEESFLDMIEVELNLIDVKDVDDASLLTLYSTELPIAKKFFDTNLLTKYFKNNLSDFPEFKATELKYGAKNITIREYKDKDKKPIGFDITYTNSDMANGTVGAYGIYIFKK